MMVQGTSSGRSTLCSPRGLRRHWRPARPAIGGVSGRNTAACPCLHLAPLRLHDFTTSVMRWASLLNRPAAQCCPEIWVLSIGYTPMPPRPVTPISAFPQSPLPSLRVHEGLDLLGATAASGTLYTASCRSHIPPRRYHGNHHSGEIDWPNLATHNLA